MTGVGALDEFHQIFVPSRTADIFDVAADAVGAAIATFILHRMAASYRAARVSVRVAPQPGD